MLAARNADDEIRTQETVLRGLRRLGDVVAVLDHPGVLDDVAQLRLSPAPAHVRGAQGVGQAPRALGEGRHLRAQRAVRLLTDPLDALELLVHLLERARERAYISRELGIGQLEETGAVRVERLRGERLHGGREALVEDAALGRQLRASTAASSLLSLDHLVHAPPALQQGRAHENEDAESAYDDPTEEGENDHEVDKR